MNISLWKGDFNVVFTEGPVNGQVQFMGQRQAVCQNVDKDVES